MRRVKRWRDRKRAKAFERSNSVNVYGANDGE
jgi:hypothetical protein